MFSFFQKKKPLLPESVCTAVAAAVKAAEQTTRGEIRVYVESRCPMVNPVDRCAELFVQLGMHRTQEANGVLIYLALHDRQFGIVGDRGINSLVGGNAYWESLAADLKTSLQSGDIGGGICTCVQSVGKSLAQYFPYAGGDNPNELPDEIVFGK